MNFSEIIESIKSGLTGNVQEDLKYLDQQAAKYTGHKLGAQILQAISEMAYDILPEDKREQVNRALFHDGRRLDVIFREARAAIDNKEFAKAHELMEDIIVTIDDYYKETDEIKFISFRNPFDEYLYHHLFVEKKKLQLPPFDLSEIFRLNGFTLIELNRVDDAIKSLGRAIEFNPVNTTAYLELAEAYKLKKDADNLYNVTKRIINIANSNIILGQCYANLGFHCIEKKDYDGAVCFYYISMRCAENPAIVGELNYIRRLTGQDIEPPSDVAIQATFSKYDLKFGPNPEVIRTAYNLGRFAHDKGDKDLARFCLGMVCDLTNDEEAKQLYASIK
jgi:tetratricopeptide (TPR) repeat protein